YYISFNKLASSIEQLIAVLLFTYPFHSRIKQETDTCRGQFFPEKLSGFRRKQPPQRLWAQVEYAYLITLPGKIIGKFTANQTGTQYRNTFFAFQSLPEPSIVVQIIDGQYLIRSFTGEGQTNRIGPQCQHKPVVKQLLTIFERNA